MSNTISGTINHGIVFAYNSPLIITNTGSGDAGSGYYAVASDPSAYPLTLVNYGQITNRGTGEGFFGGSGNYTQVDNHGIIFGANNGAYIGVGSVTNSGTI